MKIEVKYLLDADMQSTDIDKLFEPHEYADAVAMVARWLRDPEVFNVRFYYLTFIDGIFTSAIWIKTKHI